MTLETKTTGKSFVLTLTEEEGATLAAIAMAINWDTGDRFSTLAAELDEALIGAGAADLDVTMTFSLGNNELTITEDN